MVCLLSASWRDGCCPSPMLGYTATSGPGPRGAIAGARRAKATNLPQRGELQLVASDPTALRALPRRGAGSTDRRRLARPVWLHVPVFYRVGRVGFGSGP